MERFLRVSADLDDEILGPPGAPMEGELSGIARVVDE
jgi:hypothetical protein